MPSILLIVALLVACVGPAATFSDVVPELDVTGWELETVNGSSVLHLYATDIPDGCAAYRALLADQAAAWEEHGAVEDWDGYRDALSAADHAHLPEELWWVQVALVVDEATLAGDYADVSFDAFYMDGYRDWSDADDARYTGFAYGTVLYAAESAQATVAEDAGEIDATGHAAVEEPSTYAIDWAIRAAECGAT